MTADDTAGTRDGARYALFALRMLTEESREAASVERSDASRVLYSGRPSDDETIRPTR
jgi:hypothetical protein